MSLTLDQQARQTTQAALLATFYVRDALCALDAAAVQEVIRVSSVTPVRHAPPEIAGVINLRGRIVTLIDTGLMLGLGKAAPDRESRIFIIEDHNEFLGLLVDRVDEVIEVEAGSEGPLPVNIPPAQSRFFKGVCRIGGRVIALLNTGELLAENRSD